MKRVAIILAVLLITTTIIAFFIPTNASAGTENVKGSEHIPDENNNTVYWHVPPGGGPQWSNTLQVDPESDTAHDMSETVALPQRFGMGFPIREGPDDDWDLDAPMYFERGVVSGVAHLEFNESSQKPSDVRIWFSIYDENDNVKVSWGQDVPYQEDGYYEYSLEIEECMADVGEGVNMGYNFQLNSGTTTWTIYVDGSSYSILPIVSEPTVPPELAQPSYENNNLYFHAYSTDFKTQWMNAYKEDPRATLDKLEGTCIGVSSGYFHVYFLMDPVLDHKLVFDASQDIVVKVYAEIEYGAGTKEMPEGFLYLNDEEFAHGTDSDTDGDNYYVFSFDSPQNLSAGTKIEFEFRVHGTLTGTHYKVYVNGSSYITLPIDTDTDGDGIYNAIDTDDDGDGMPDNWENTYGLNPFVNDAGEDPDNDNLTNLKEYQHNADPTNPDTDGDGLADGEEVLTYGTDPTEPDTDGDGYNDKVDYYPLDPNKHEKEKAIEEKKFIPGFEATSIIIMLGICVLLLKRRKK